MDFFTFLLLGACMLLLARVLGKKKERGAAGGASRRSESHQPNPRAIGDNFRTLAEVERALRKAGLESSDLILAVDFTKSNTWQGEQTFFGQSLHLLSDAPGQQNPYQQVIATLADVLLQKLDDDCQVPMYGFGDMLTGNRKVFLLNNEQTCRNKAELLNAYADAAANVTLSGPTSFAPIIHEAIDVVKSTGKYHILVIIADGLMDDVHETTRAIVAASQHALSIVLVGVGDGPWEQMETFDDDIPERQFDNFQFVNFTKLLMQHHDPAKRAVQFALEALMELPEQYLLIKKAGLLGRSPERRVTFPYRLRGKHHFAPRNNPEGLEWVEPPPYAH